VSNDFRDHVGPRGQKRKGVTVQRSQARVVGIGWLIAVPVAVVGVLIGRSMVAGFPGVVLGLCFALGAYGLFFIGLIIFAAVRSKSHPS
jgi:hypothetical protein